MRKLSLLTTVGVVLALSSGASAAAAASLTSTEYQTMVTYEASALTRSLKTVAEVRRAERACLRIKPATGLLRATRSDCTATYMWIETSAAALAKAKSCNHTNVDARFACLMSSYVRLAADVRTLYRTDGRLYRVVKARGFTGACSHALSDGPRAVAYEGQMAKDIARMVVAIRATNVLAAQKWGSLYDAATAEAAAAAQKASVLACPHQ